MRVQDVAAALALDDRFRAWLDEVGGLDGEEASEPGTTLRPEPMAALLRRVGCSDAAVEDACGTLPSPRRDGARWQLLQRSRLRLAATIGDIDAVVGRWPSLPEHLGVAGRCFPLHLFAAALPAARAFHADRGVPDEVSWATLADLGRHEAIHRRMHGTTGVDVPSWMLGHLRGLLLEVGGLQYAPYRVGGPGSPDPWYGPSDEASRRVGLRPGDMSVGLHIPTGAALDDGAVTASLTRAAQLLDVAFPAPHRRVLTCSSWLLDDQLAGLLGADSRIVGFARSWTLAPGWVEADSAVLGFAFGKQGIEPSRNRARTRLQRAVLDHLDAGGHFRWRTGWRELGIL